MNTTRVCGRALLSAVAVLSCACADQQRKSEEHLAELVTWLPGHYDNSAQAESDEQHGVRPPHERLSLVVVPLDSIAVGRNAFYVQEMAADDPRRVMSQKVLMFSATSKGIVETVSSLNDPLRWRDGHLQPDVFKGMVRADLLTPPGCDLTWQKKDDEHFLASSDSTQCRGTSHAVMGLVRIDSRAELSAQEFALGQVVYDDGGRLVEGRLDEPLYRFRKQRN